MTPLRPAPEMSVRLLEVGEPGWADTLTRVRHDVAHLPSYREAIDTHRRTRSRLLVVEQGERAMVVPLIFSEIGDGPRCDAASPDPLATPLFTDGTDPAWRRAAIAAMLVDLEARGVVSLFLRLHPLLDSAPQDFAHAGTVVEHGTYFTIPLDRPLAEIRAAMRKSHRRAIRAAWNAGVVAEPDPDWRHVDTLHTMYAAAMTRLEAGTNFRLPRDHWDRVRDALADRAQLWVLKYAGEVIAIDLVTEHDGIVQSLHGAMEPDQQRKFSMLPVYDSLLEWAHTRGNRHFFLDGAAHESLRVFKRGITTVEPVSRTGRIVVNPTEYRALCDDWETASGHPVGPIDTFFPPYRQPVGRES
ncbi:GNAT family N-acetyltransferase [Granulicoccus phenolivorans]|uniref:GNAT family N-acetyltransferase n=1 Tax=Granulicoccus phenolivorans TaxID=266854 RepID=UPI0004052FF6|nr:GNAT family N-acetyltransferase [Granulicoccus phenolivorans]